MDLYANVYTFGQFPFANTLTFGQFVNVGATYAIYVNKNNPLDDLTSQEPYIYSDSSPVSFEYNYEPNSIYYIGIAPINECGGLESEEATWIAIKTDASGNIAGQLVGNIAWAQITQQSAGQIKIRWRYDNDSPAAGGFKIYTSQDEINWQQVATESYQRGKDYYSITIQPSTADGFVGIAAYSGSIESQQLKVLRFSGDSSVEVADCYARIS